MCACPQGCCDDNNQCRPGTEDEACGGGNDWCDNCAQGGGTCSNQQCEQGPCDGCTAFGYCMPGDSNWACGTGGAQCQFCQGGTQCVSGQCQ
jgi:hypothetical protein